MHWIMKGETRKLHPKPYPLAKARIKERGSRASSRRGGRARRDPARHSSSSVHSPRENQHQGTVASRTEAKIPRADASSDTVRRSDRGIYRPPGSRIPSSGSEIRAPTKEGSKIKVEESSEGAKVEPGFLATARSGDLQVRFRCQ